MTRVSELYRSRNPGEPELVGVEYMRHVAKDLLGFKFINVPQGSVFAEVNHGRWVAGCLFCTGAQAAAPGVPFFCFSCGMAKNDGYTANIIFPDNAEAIEQALLLRPMANRNWIRGETIDFLIAENREHGA